MLFYLCSQRPERSESFPALGQGGSRVTCRKGSKAELRVLEALHHHFTRVNQLLVLRLIKLHISLGSKNGPLFKQSLKATALVNVMIQTLPGLLIFKELDHKKMYFILIVY